MMLYDIYWLGKECDFSTSLPSSSKGARYARNTNWDGHTYVPSHNGWKEEKKGTYETDAHLGSMRGDL